MISKKGIFILIIMLISFGIIVIYLSMKGNTKNDVIIQTDNKTVKAKDKVEMLIEARKNEAKEEEAGKTQGKNVDGSKGSHRVVTDIEIEMAVLGRLIENNPLDVGAHKKRLDLYNSVYARFLNPDPNDKFLNKALKDVNDAVKLKESDNLELLKLRAEIQRCLGHYGDSVSELSDVINKLNPDTDGVSLTSLYERRGECYEKMEKLEDAIKDYSEAIKLVPSIPDDYFSRARCYQLMGQYEEAIADYNSIFAISKENEGQTSVLQQRGMSYFKNKKYDDAIIDFDKLIGINPEDSGYYFYKALSFDNMGKSQDALKFYKECLDRTTSTFLFDRSIAQKRIDELEK